MSIVRHESGPDAGAVWHYGDPMREQRLLAERARAAFLDGIGEIANVAADVFKASRLEAGERVQIGLPLFMEGRGCIEFFASGLQGLSQSLNGPDGIAVHVILIWQEGKL